MVKSVYSSSPGAVKQLEAHEEVSRLTMSRGQVLLYCEHQPSGIFVLLRGAASLARDGGGQRCVQLERAGAQPVMLPGLEDLQRPSAVTITILEPSELLHVPRSLVLSTLAVRQLLLRGELRSPRSRRKGPQP